MRIDSLLYLTGGALQSNPTIKSFSHIRHSPRSIKRGDLFLAKDPEAIEEAIQNGAYVILYDKEVAVTDPEIAWIRVDSLELAALKLLRFLLIRDQIPLHLLDPLTFDLAREFLLAKDLLFSLDPLSDLAAYSEKEVRAILFSQRGYFPQLALDTTPLERGSFQILTRYLFECSCIYEGAYYERIKIAPLFGASLHTIFDLATHYQLELSLHTPPRSHFSPNFLAHDFTLAEFGTTERVLILESDQQLAQQAKTYLEQQAPWAAKLYLSDRKLDGFLTIDSIDGLKEILYNRAFNFALFVGAPLELDRLAQKRVIKTLL